MDEIHLLGGNYTATIYDTGELYFVVWDYDIPGVNNYTKVNFAGDGT